MKNREYYITRIGFAILILVMALLLAYALCSCYTPRVAERQVSHAGDRYPEVLARAARSMFPCDTTGTVTITSSDSLGYQSVIDQLVTEIDRLTAEGPVIIAVPGDTTCDVEAAIIRDLRAKVAALKPVLIHLPPIHDTVWVRTSVIDRAAVVVCQGELDKVVGLLVTTTAERDKYRKRSRTYFWIILAMGAVIGVGVCGKVRTLFKIKS